MRNWHYLHAGRATGWPQQSVALSVVCSAGAVKDDRQRTRTVRLLGWAATAWTGIQGQAEATEVASGVTAADWWNWLTPRLKRGRTTWLWQMYACAGMTALGLWGKLTRKDWQLCGTDYQDRQSGGGQKSSRSSGLCVVSDPPTILLARPFGGGGSSHWLDVRNLSSRLTWDAIGEDAGSVAIGAGDSNLWQSGRELALLRARALAAWLQDWYGVVRDLRLGGLRATAAAQAWHGWRTSYLTCPVEVHNDEERLRAERESTYGGRCEVFAAQRVLTGVYELDASAHYPACASVGPLPGRISRAAHGYGNGSRVAAKRGLLVIARGRVSTDRPCLPRRRGGLTVYPVGSWRGTYCWPEIELLERTGGRFDCEQWYGYEPAEPFHLYFAQLWLSRQGAVRAGRKGTATAIKLLMNSLVGRCAAVNRYWEDRPDVFYPEPWAQWYQRTGPDGKAERWRSIAWRVQREVEGGTHPESVPALAAWIYSLARVRLYHWLEVAGREEIYYTDTDSLWTSATGFDRLVAAGAMGGDELGALRLRAKHPWARFYGHKHYETPQGVTCAGVPRSALASTDGGRQWWCADTPAAASRHGGPPKLELVRYDVADRRCYRGGRIAADGTVYPFEEYGDE